MKCEEGNRLNLEEYLFSLGFTTTKIRGDNLWYMSALRDKKKHHLNRSKQKRLV